MLKRIKRKCSTLTSCHDYNKLIAVCLQEALRFKSLFKLILIPTIITLSLYSVIFVDVLGAKIHDMEGLPYRAFVIPGLIIMTVISNVFGHVTGSLYSSKRQGYVSEQLTTGMPEWFFIFGYLFGGLLRGITVAVVGFLVIFILVGYKPNSLFLSMLIVIVTSILFSLFGIVIGLLAKKIETLSAFSMYVIVPCSMFGGVYYSPHMLRGIWYQLTVADPIYYIVSAFRQACSGVYSENIGSSLLILIGIILVLVFIAKILTHRVSYKTE